MDPELELIKEQLALLDEITVMDLLNLTLPELLDRCEDLIIENYGPIKEAFYIETGRSYDSR